MTMTRRAALRGGAAASLVLAAPGLARAATAERRFTILRDGSEIGTHRVALAQDGDALRAEIDIDIAVRILGIAAYRYEMTNRETWRAGRLISVDSRVNDDGDAKRVSVRRDGGMLMVEGSNYTGPAPDDAASTTYFTKDFLARRTWISTDAGDLLQVSNSNLGAGTVQTADGPQQVSRYRVSDGRDYDVEVSYDAAAEWLGIAFDAGGERATYRLDGGRGRFAELWNA